MPVEAVIKDRDGDYATVTNGRLDVNADLSAVDIQIGAVEIKDADSDTRAQVDANGSLQCILYDTQNRDLDFRQEAENVNAADHGLLIYARDYESTPNKYRMIRCGAEGYLEAHVEGSSDNYIEPINNDFDTSGGTETVSSFGIALPADGGSVIGGTSTNPINVDIQDISAGTQTNDVKVTLDGETVKPNALKKLSANSYDVDDTAVQVFDASANASATSVSITNAGDESIYLYFTSSVTSVLFFKKLDAGESWEYPLGYTSDTTNDVYAIRASAQTNDNVVTIVYGEI